MTTFDIETIAGFVLLREEENLIYLPFLPEKEMIFLIEDTVRYWQRKGISLSALNIEGILNILYQKSNRKLENFVLNERKLNNFKPLDKWFFACVERYMKRIVNRDFYAQFYCNYYFDKKYDYLN